MTLLSHDNMWAHPSTLGACRMLTADDSRNAETRSCAPLRHGAGCLLALTMACLNSVAWSQGGEELLRGLTSEERAWVEQSCSRSLGPSLYFSCLRREAAAAKAPIQGLENLDTQSRAWLDSSCSRSLGPQLYRSCAQRELRALAAGMPDLQGLDNQTRAWLESSCSRSLGPALYRSCMERELRAIGAQGNPRTSVDAPTARPPTSAPRPEASTAPRAIAKPRGTTPREALRGDLAARDWPAWNGPRPAMPGRIGVTALTPAQLFGLGSASVYLVVAGKTSASLSSGTNVATGSAVAISERHLLTNCHIVEDHPVVLVRQTTRAGKATLLYADAKLDRCILESQELRLQAVQGIRGYDDLAIGERVYSIGSPSALENTLGEGLISGLRKSRSARFIQTTAPISPGSSGGALFDSRGNLIGITTAFITGAQNINFAIAAEDFWSER